MSLEAASFSCFRSTHTSRTGKRAHTLGPRNASTLLNSIAVCFTPRIRTLHALVWTQIILEVLAILRQPKHRGNTTRRPFRRVMLGTSGNPFPATGAFLGRHGSRPEQALIGQAVTVDRRLYR